MATIFKRVEGHTPPWWHWKPACVFWQSMPGWKDLGQEIIIEEVESGFPDSVPGEFSLCPGCLSLHNRTKSRDPGLYVKRVVEDTVYRVVSLVSRITT